MYPTFANIILNRSTFNAMNLIYTVDPYSQEPIILVNKHIGNDPEDGMGIDGAQFQAELMQLDTLRPKRIQVYINSVGGSVIDLMNMYSAILHTTTPVDTYNMGMAASSAGVLFQAGRKRYMMDYAKLMYHNVHGSDDKKLLNVMNDSINKMTTRSGKSTADIKAMMDKTTYIDAADALEYGMCDEVLDSAEHNKKRMSHFAAAPMNGFAKEANLILNSIIKKENKSMKLVANKLGLSEDAGESSIVAEVTKLQNKVSTIEAKALADATSLTEIQNKLTAAEAEVATLKTEKETAERAANKEKCKNMVEGFAKIGKIANTETEIEFYTTLAEADGGFEIIKARLEALPVNKNAPKIEVQASDAGTKKVYTMAGQMGLIANKVQAQK